jgi:hypothetical protein
LVKIIRKMILILRTVDKGGSREWVWCILFFKIFFILKYFKIIFLKN